MSSSSLDARCARIDLQNEMDEVTNIPVENAASSVRESKLRDYLARIESEDSALWWDDDERSPFLPNTEEESASQQPDQNDPDNSPDAATHCHSIVDAWRMGCQKEKRWQEDFEKRNDLAVRIPAFHLPPSKRWNTPWYFDDGVYRLERDLEGLQFREAHYRMEHFERYMKDYCSCQ